MRGTANAVGGAVTGGLGTVVALYATGLGRTVPPMPDGEIRLADLVAVAP